MIAAQSYNLVYTGLHSPQHLLRLTKSKIVTKALSQTDNAKLANFFLRLADFDSVASEKIVNHALQSGDYKRLVNAERLGEQYKHIHSAKSDEIQERMIKPELTADEANEMLFELEIQKELEKISKRSKGIALNLSV